MQEYALEIIVCTLPQHPFVLNDFIDSYKTKQNFSSMRRHNLFHLAGPICMNAFAMGNFPRYLFEGNPLVIGGFPSQKVK